MLERWRQSADAEFKEPMNRFCSYVSRYLIPVVRDRVISENAELAGLESPYEVLEEFRPFVSKSADNLINPDLFEQERKRRKAKMLNADFSDVLS